MPSGAEPLKKRSSEMTDYTSLLKEDDAQLRVYVHVHVPF